MFKRENLTENMHGFCKKATKDRTLTVKGLLFRLKAALKKHIAFTEHQYRVIFSISNKKTPREYASRGV